MGTPHSRNGEKDLKGIHSMNTSHTFVFGDAMMRMDPMLVVKRPNSGTLFPPFILRISFFFEMTVRFGIGMEWC